MAKRAYLQIGRRFEALSETVTRRAGRHGRLAASSSASSSCGARRDRSSTTPTPGSSSSTPARPSSRS